MKRLLAGAVALTLIACHESPTGTVDPADLQLLVVSGDGQEGLPFTELTEALVVRVLNATGKAGVPNQVVNFRVVEGGGSVYGGVATTDPQGIAKEYWTLGAPGPQRLEARAVNAAGEKLVYGVFTATAVSDLFFDEAAFVAATGATPTVTYPDIKAGSAVPYTENGVSMEQKVGFLNGVQPYTTILDGYEFGVSGAENIDITFATPVTAFGIWMQDGYAVGDIAAPGKDSRFTFTFYAGAVVVKSFEVDPPIDEAFFVGLALDQSVDRLEVREVGSTDSLGDQYNENDFFGVIYTK